MPVPGSPATAVGAVNGETRYPVARCMAVALHVTDADTGAPLRLRPYLGAAAHVYVARERKHEWRHVGRGASSAAQVLRGKPLPRNTSVPRGTAARMSWRSCSLWRCSGDGPP